MNYSLIPHLIIDLCTADSFILTIVDGNKAGSSYLIDELLENAIFRKFSGTNQAGQNTDDFPGRTSDTFAHFSLYHSEGTSVYVDIQGSCSKILLISLIPHFMVTSST